MLTQIVRTNVGSVRFWYISLADHEHPQGPSRIRKCTHDFIQL